MLLQQLLLLLLLLLFPLPGAVAVVVLTMTLQVGRVILQESDAFIHVEVDCAL